MASCLLGRDLAEELGNDFRNSIDNIKQISNFVQDFSSVKNELGLTAVKFALYVGQV